MRLIFWLFLLLNLSFFYWQYSQPQETEPPLIQSNVLPAGVERLVLLRERGLGMPKNTKPSDELTVIEPSVPAAENKRHALTALHQSAAKVSSVPVAEVKAETATEKVIAKPVAVVMSCFSVGPFTNEAAAGQMYKALLPLDIVVEQRLRKKRVIKNYWVYLPPQKNYKLARRKVQALQKMGLEDMYIMGDGAMKNAISLGLFKRKSTATERFNEVHKIDASTVMKTQYRVVTKKWLDLKLDSTQTDKLARIVSLAKDLPGGKLEQQNSCK